MIPEKAFTDQGLTGAGRARPGLREALAACRAGDTLVVTKRDRLARSLGAAKTSLTNSPAARSSSASAAPSRTPPIPVGRLLFNFNVLAMVAEFEADLVLARTLEGMAVAKGKGPPSGETAQAFQNTGSPPGLRSPSRDTHGGGTCRILRDSVFNRLPCHQTRRRHRRTA
ncbi:recombinase family protein [Arthrobacter sp. MA-N2]|uniref:recombinase family protein n=1 Tax=Arthrobacter sp. MA-N2 TaxID=1101188 RepID=UPI0018CC495B|nr:recombinase family protein [Arthrobacter sp. MA-N2]